MAIKHAFTSGKSDGSDPTLVRASNWDADHVLDVAAPSGLTGATTPARFVGGTVAGAPSTGTFAAGDFVTSQDGKIYICTSAGSPGIWLAVSGGADLVQVASGAGSIRIPGLGGSPDRLPAAPSAYDDEFDTLEGWTTLGTLDVLNVTDFPSHLHMSKNSIGTLTVGAYKAMPPTPFTVTAKLGNCKLDSNFVSASLMLAEAAPGKFFHLGPLFGGYGGSINDLVASYWSSPTVRGVAYDSLVVFRRATWLQLVVNGPQAATPKYSVGGLIWVTRPPLMIFSFVPANVGLVIAGHNGGGDTEAIWDWMRFTFPSYKNAIPVMTDYTVPSGQAISSTSHAVTPTWTAFNTASPYSGWITDGSALPQWIGYKFDSSQTVVSYQFGSWFYDSYPTRNPKDWEFQGSNDNWATHTVLDAQTNWASADMGAVNLFTISSPGSFQSYRLYVTANNGNAYYTGLSMFNMNVAR